MPANSGSGNLDKDAESGCANAQSLADSLSENVTPIIEDSFAEDIVPNWLELVDCQVTDSNIARALLADSALYPCPIPGICEVPIQPTWWQLAVEPNIAVELSGKCSSDPCGIPISEYAWQVIGGPAKAVWLTSQTIMEVGVIFPVVGEYMVRLDVKNAIGAHSCSSAWLTVIVGRQAEQHMERDYSKDIGFADP